MCGRLSLCPCTAPLSCNPATTPQVVAFESWTISAPICLNRFAFAESRKPDLWTYLCVCFYLFFFGVGFSDRNELQLEVPVCNLVVVTTATPLLFLPCYSFFAVSEIFNHFDDGLPSVCNAVGLLILFKLCPVFTFLQQLMTRGLWVIYTYTCSPMFSIDVVASAPDDPCICWNYFVGSDYCAMRFAYALHMHRQNLVLLSCLYTEPFELVIEIVFHYCTTPCWHKTNLFKRSIRGSRFERLDNAFMLLSSLIFLYPQKILISVRWPFEL